MGIDSVLSRTLSLKKDRAKQDCTRIAVLEEIKSLKRQLVELGYHPDEVKYMINQLAGNQPLEDGSPAAERVQDGLRQQIALAGDCLRLVRKEKDR